MKGIIQEDFDWNGTHYNYEKGQEIIVTESERAIFNYETEKKGIVDLIPRSIVKIIEK